MSESTDITKAVMTEGTWYLVPAEYVNDWVVFDHSSVIVHKCGVPAADETWGLRPGSVWEYTHPLTYWTRQESLKNRCGLCDMRPPEAIASLFMLHNFDTFAGEKLMNRVISECAKKSNYDFNKHFLKGDGV